MTIPEQKQQIFLCLKQASCMNRPTAEEMGRAAKKGIAELCDGDSACNLVIANLLLRGGDFSALISPEQHGQLLEVLNEAKRKYAEMITKPLTVTRFLENISESATDITNP